MLKFDEVRKGYDKMQVEEYVRMLKGEYIKLQDELETVNLEHIGSEKDTETINILKAEKIKLEQENKELREQAEQAENLPVVQESAYSEAIASAIVSAEISAKHIIAKAQSEAAGINESAVKELEDIIAAKQQVYDEIRQVSKRLLRIIRDGKTVKETDPQTAELPEKVE